MPDKKIRDEILLTNINRVFYLSLLSVLIRILTIGSLLISELPISSTEVLWIKGIVSSHILYLILMLIIGGLSFKMRQKKQADAGMIIVQYSAIMVLLFTTVKIVAIDQLITPSITPFIIVCVAVGSIFLISPVHSLVIFLLGYIYYFFMIGTTQTDKSVLLSNKINGLTSISLGIFLSFLLWRQNVINFMQKGHIELQQKELEMKNEKLRYLAAYDVLTGLLNRRYFEKEAQKEIKVIKQNGNKLCFLILDIDYFKNINDEYGHPVGDEVLNNRD